MVKLVHFSNQGFNF